MKYIPKSKNLIILAVGAVIAWSALILQFLLMILNRVASVAETVIRFFSFYTILSNILVACCFTALLIKYRSGKESLFTLPETFSATVLYITIVGAVYNLVLRNLWAPQGLQRVVDELLHSIIPVFFVLYWIILVPKGNLHWKTIFSWLIFPLVYLIVILFRGAYSGFYPYPFIDVNVLGYNNTLLNCAYITIAFIMLSILIIGFSKITGRKSKSI
jgi:hypothetical protein